MLRQEAGKSRKQGGRKWTVHAGLVVLAVMAPRSAWRLATNWKAARQQERRTYEPQHVHAAGVLRRKAFQFDWSRNSAWCTTTSCRSLTSTTAPASPSFSPRLSAPDPMVSTPWHAFRVFSSVPRVDQYGSGRSTRSAAHEAPGRRRFSAIVGVSSSRPVTRSSLRVRKGAGVGAYQDPHHRLWQPMPDFPFFCNTLNNWLDALPSCRAGRCTAPDPSAIVDVLSAEKIERLIQLSTPHSTARPTPACGRRAWSVRPQSLQRARVLSPIVRYGVHLLPDASLPPRDSSSCGASSRFFLRTKTQVQTTFRLAHLYHIISARTARFSADGARHNYTLSVLCRTHAQRRQATGEIIDISLSFTDLTAAPCSLRRTSSRGRRADRARISDLYTVN